MGRMYRVLAFWTLAIAVMGLIGGVTSLAVLFFVQTFIFLMLGYSNLSERAYMLIFWGYMVVSFTGITVWSFFFMKLQS